jgi:hypothetical protein
MREVQYLPDLCAFFVLLISDRVVMFASNAIIFGVLIALAIG